jgi:hypothetical protein
MCACREDSILSVHPCANYHLPGAVTRMKVQTIPKVCGVPFKIAGMPNSFELRKNAPFDQTLAFHPPWQTSSGRVVSPQNS